MTASRWLCYGNIRIGRPYARAGSCIFRAGPPWRRRTAKLSRSTLSLGHACFRLCGWLRSRHGRGAFILYEIFVGVPALYPSLISTFSLLSALLLHAGILGYHQAESIVYRYIDWSLTVPLQMIELHCVLKVVKSDLCSGLF